MVARFNSYRGLYSVLTLIQKDKNKHTHVRTYIYTRSNLPTNQQTALKDLSSKNDIVIKEADKGGAITIINKEDCITDCNTTRR